MTTVTTIITGTLLASTALADTAGEEALDRMLAWYASQPGAQTSMSTSISGPDGAAFDTTTTMAFIRPNLIKVVSDGKKELMPDMTVVCDGKTLWEALPSMQVWSEKDAPPVLTTESSLVLQVGTAGAVLDLFAKDAKMDLLDGFGEPTVKSSSQDGDVIELKSEDMPDMPTATLELTLGPKAAPWINRIAVSMAMAPGQEPQEMAVMTFENWKSLSDTPEHRAMFTFDDRSKWKKVDDIAVELMGEAPGPPSSGEPNKMVGKPAPDFTLTSLKGKEVSLESLRGKTIILDFWATWCGPCKQGLPVLMEVAKARAADGVELWSVDLNEKNSKVENFLKQRSWDLRVLMDTKGSVANSYGVKGIPHTVVIDPEGVVRLVEVGFGGAEHVKKAMNTIIDEIVGG